MEKRAALEALSKAKDEEKVQAIEALRREIQAKIDQAYAERDEHLANYSKVAAGNGYFFDVLTIDYYFTGEKGQEEAAQQVAGAPGKYSSHVSRSSSVGS